MGEEEVMEGREDGEGEGEREEEENREGEEVARVGVDYAL